METPIADYRKISRRHAASGLLTAITAGQICYALGKPTHFKTDKVVPQNVQSFINSFAPRQFPGIAIALRGSAATWIGEAGYRNLATHAPIRASDAIGIGSITKTFVAVVAMQLEEAGRLSLDASALDYLGSQKLGNVANIGNASIAQLMGHTSGIPSPEEDPVWIRDARGAGINPTKIWSPTASLEYIFGKPALSAPGVEYNYSNSNYIILGLIIQAITGNSLWHEIAKRICAPLNLSNTFMDGISKPTKITNCANRYHYLTRHFENAAGITRFFTRVRDDLLDVSKTNLSCEWADGNIVSTAPDVAEFFSALRCGKLVKPTSLEFMTTWRQAGALGLGQFFYVGHGLFRQASGKHSIVGHTGGVLGSTANAFWIEGCPIAYAALSNFGTEDTGQSSRTTANSVAQSPKFVEMLSSLASNSP